MGFSVHIAEAAENDITDSFFWYESQESGLGFRFKNNLEQSILHIQKHPTRFPKKLLSTRVCFLSNFPYGIHFNIDFNLNQILIVAVFHTSRNPNVWKNRIQK